MPIEQAGERRVGMLLLLKQRRIIASPVEVAIDYRKEARHATHPI